MVPRAPARAEARPHRTDARRRRTGHRGACPRTAAWGLRLRRRRRGRPAPARRPHQAPRLPGRQGAPAAAAWAGSRGRFIPACLTAQRTRGASGTSTSQGTVQGLKPSRRQVKTRRMGSFSHWSRQRASRSFPSCQWGGLVRSMLNGRPLPTSRANGVTDFPLTSAPSAPWVKRSGPHTWPSNSSWVGPPGRRATRDMSSLGAISMRISSKCRRGTGPTSRTLRVPRSPSPRSMATRNWGNNSACQRSCSIRANVSAVFAERRAASHAPAVATALSAAVEKVAISPHGMSMRQDCSPN